MKKKVSIKIELYVKFEYDPESTEFKNSLEAYRILYNEEGDEGDFLAMIAENLVKYGIERPIESLGYLSVNGRFPNQKKEKDWIGVNLIETPLYKDGILKFTTYTPIEIQK